MMWILLLNPGKTNLNDRMKNLKALLFLSSNDGCLLQMSRKAKSNKLIKTERKHHHEQIKKLHVWLINPMSSVYLFDVYILFLFKVFKSLGDLFFKPKKIR